MLILFGLVLAAPFIECKGLSPGLGYSPTIRSEDQRPFSSDFNDLSLFEIFLLVLAALLVLFLLCYCIVCVCNFLRDHGFRCCRCCDFIDF